MRQAAAADCWEELLQNGEKGATSAIISKGKIMENGPHEYVMERLGSDQDRSLVHSLDVVLRVEGQHMQVRLLRVILWC